MNQMGGLPFNIRKELEVNSVSPSMDTRAFSYKYGEGTFADYQTRDQNDVCSTAMSRYGGQVGFGSTFFSGSASHRFALNEKIAQKILKNLKNKPS